MSCNNPTIAYLQIDRGLGVDNAPLTSVDTASPGLFVSDAPESIGPGVPSQNFPWTFGTGPHTLNKVHLTGTDVPARVRAFVWHACYLGQATHWALLVGSSGGGIRIERKGSNWQCDSCQSIWNGNLYRRGLSLSNAQCDLHGRN